MEKEKDTGFRKARVNYFNPLGSKTRKTYVWNDDKTALIETGEVDIQAEIDEAAKGMSAPEQIARIMRGDTSCVQDGEGFYGDVSEAPESEIDAMAAALAPDHVIERAARDNNLEIAELKARIAKLEEEENSKKAEAQTEQTEVKENA